MSNKQWYKNIPHQGILCKSKADENFIFNAVKFIESDDYDVIYIIDANGDKHELDDIHPITSKDWWKFVPWQPIETMQTDKPYLIIANGIIQDILYAVNDNGDIYIWNSKKILSTLIDIDKCLPLPEVNNEQQ